MTTSPAIWRQQEVQESLAGREIAFSPIFLQQFSGWPRHTGAAPAGENENSSTGSVRSDRHKGIIMQRLLAFCVGLCVLAFTQVAGAQGFLISSDHSQRFPRPWPQPTPDPSTMTCQVKELSVQARLKDQVAQVQVSQTFLNTGSRQLEAQFVFPLPYDGAIDKLTLMVDGKEFPAQLLTKEDARARYEAIVRSSKDPALLEWMGQGLFQTSVFPVPAGQTRTVTLHYNQLLRKDRGARFINEGAPM